jgi:hypothetical protein
MQAESIIQNPGYTEIEKLRRQLQETQEVIAAIQGGSVDALVVPSESGEKIFTLVNADRPYRILLEKNVLILKTKLHIG